MKMEKEIYGIILDELKNKGKRVETPEYEDLAAGVTEKLLSAGYIRYDSIDLDPQKCVQLLAAILNAFKQDRPYVVVEKEEDKEDNNA